MKFFLHVAVTPRKKCREGFYVLMNGARLRFARKADALAAIESWLALQRVQICTVRQFTDRNRKRIASAQFSERRQAASPAAPWKLPT